MKLRGLGLVVALALSACTGSGTPHAVSGSLPGTPSPTPTSTITPAARPAVLAPPLPGAPRRFVAVLAGRLAVFDATTGHRLRWLTSPAANVEDTDPHIVVERGGSSVVFARLQPGVCARTDLLRVPLIGGKPTTVLRLPPSQFDALDVERDGSALAYGVTSCRDSEPTVRVIALPSGRTLATATSRCCDNGVFSLANLELRGDRLAMSLGEHNSSWTSLLRVRSGRGPVLIEDLPQLPTPAACRTTSILWASSGGQSVLRTTETCGFIVSDQTTHLVEYSGGSLQRRQVGKLLGRGALDSDLSGADGAGNLIGLRSYDTEARYERRILQLGPHGERALAACTDVNGTQDACATQPVW